MKLSSLLAASLVAALPAAATLTTATLTAVSEPGFNEIELQFSPPLLPQGTGTTNLSGTVDVALEIDPDTDQVSEMTITGGAVSGTPLTLSGQTPFVGSYNLTSSTLGATLDTPLPPGTVDPATGEFDAAQHTFTVSSGTLGGTISVPLAGINETINFDFADTPVGGAGNGTGTVTLTPTGSTPTSRSYQATVILPIDVSEVFEVEGPTGPIEIPISATGTAKLVGPVTIAITAPNPYLIWTEVNGMSGALFDGDDNGDGVPNGIQWALGLASTDSPFPHLLQPASRTETSVEFTLTFPSGGCATEITVLGSHDPLGSPFAPLDPAAVSAGNPIPAGTTSATISFGPGGPLAQNAVGLLQLMVDDPAAE